MKDLQENKVPAVGQVKRFTVRFENTGLRILFIGNSITKHSPRPEMGWTNDCGMAASDIDHDYVHLLLQKIRTYDPHTAFAIAQVGSYEANLLNGSKPIDNHAELADFAPDIIITFFGANVPKLYDETESPARTFTAAYEELLAFFDPEGKAAVVHGAGFYLRPKLDAEKRAIAAKRGEPFVSLGDIPTREDTHGRFNHPSDLGMKEIADAFWSALEPLVKNKVCGRKN